MNGNTPTFALALAFCTFASPVLAEGDDVQRLPTSIFAVTAKLPSVSGPDWYVSTPEGQATRPGPDGMIVVKGRRSYSEERAHQDARAQLELTVAEWLAPEVPIEWKPPANLIDSLLIERCMAPVQIDHSSLGLDSTLPLPDVLYVAGYRAELSSRSRSDLLTAYHREVGDRRMTIAAGALGFVLACLGILVSYIRADEATRGYYTNRLRLVAAATAGAAGFAAYRWLA